MKWWNSIKNRKLGMFILSLVIMALLIYLDKNPMSIVYLYSAYVVGNAASKFANKNIGEIPSA